MYMHPAPRILFLWRSRAAAEAEYRRRAEEGWQTSQRTTEVFIMLPLESCPLCLHIYVNPAF